jgi:PhzF family phenazine biosynthesis protein
MTNLKFWLVDAFTDQPFKGNPAAVYILEDEISDTLMQKIAVEMNQSETAFVLLRSGQNPLLRWFTPTFEIDLCGHATLASAHVVMTEVDSGLLEMTFDSRFAGPLRVQKQATRYTLDFPSRAGEPTTIESLPQSVLNAISTHQPREAFKSRDLMLVYDNEEIIRDMRPDWGVLEKFDDYLIVTAPSTDPRYDFVSRFFCAGDGIVEDPVTGSAHCTLAPYWAAKLKKQDLRAYQASVRGGELFVKLRGERVLISGDAITIAAGALKKNPRIT